MKVNILHLYQNASIGGIQQQARSIILAYDRERFNPVFCTLGPRGPIMDELEDSGIECIALGHKRLPRLSPTLALRVGRLLKERAIHVLRAHKYRANLYGRLGAMIAGTPVVVTSMHGRSRKDRGPGRRLMNRLLAGRSDMFVAVSEAIRDDVSSYNPIPHDRFMIIRNGVDTEAFSPERAYPDVRAEFGIPRDALVMGFIGRMTAGKGAELLVGAFGELAPERDDIRLLMVGDGVLATTIQEMVRALGLGDRVILAGHRRDIPAIMSALDMFVMPSLSEGFPNVLLEALSMGLPTVATAVGGIPEIIVDGVNGRLIPAGSVGAIRDAVRDMLGNMQMSCRMGHAARDFIEADYGIRATASAWESLYMRLLREKGFLLPPQWV